MRRPINLLIALSSVLFITLTLVTVLAFFPSKALANPGESGNIEIFPPDSTLKTDPGCVDPLCGLNANDQFTDSAKVIYLNELADKNNTTPNLDPARGGGGSLVDPSFPSVIRGNDTFSGKCPSSRCYYGNQTGGTGNFKSSIEFDLLSKTYEETNAVHWWNCGGCDWTTWIDTSVGAVGGYLGLGTYAAQKILIPESVTKITSVRQFYTRDGNIGSVELKEADGCGTADTCPIVAGTSAVGPTTVISPVRWPNYDQPWPVDYFDNLNWTVIPGKHYWIVFNGPVSLPINSSCFGGNYNNDWPQDLPPGYNYDGNSGNTKQDVIFPDGSLHSTANYNDPSICAYSGIPVPQGMGWPIAGGNDSPPYVGTPDGGSASQNHPHNALNPYPDGIADSPSYLFRGGGRWSDGAYTSATPCSPVGSKNGKNTCVYVSGMNGNQGATIARMAVWGLDLIMPGPPTVNPTYPTAVPPQTTPGCAGQDEPEIELDITGATNFQGFEITRHDVTTGVTSAPIDVATTDPNFKFIDGGAGVISGHVYYYTVRAYNDLNPEGRQYSAPVDSGTITAPYCDITPPTSVAGTTLQGCYTPSGSPLFPPVNAWGTDSDTGISYVTGYLFKDTPPSADPSTWKTTRFKEFSAPTPPIAIPTPGYSGQITIPQFNPADPSIFPPNHVFYMTYSATNPSSDPATNTGYSTAIPQAFWIANACKPFFKTQNGDVHSNGGISVQGTAP